MRDIRGTEFKEEKKGEFCHIWKKLILSFDSNVHQNHNPTYPANIFCCSEGVTIGLFNRKKTAEVIEISLLNHETFTL